MADGIHFRTRWCPPAILGRRAITVNLSDIAAMGGTPLAAVVNLAVPLALHPSFFDRLYDGLRAAAARVRLDIVGGNVVRSDILSITITILGELRGPALRRDTARVGDTIFVTGTIGDAAAGVRILDGKMKARGVARQFLVDRFLDPSARLEAGRRLAKLVPTPAAIDISDGLVQDLGHIAHRSRVAAEVDTDAIPLSRAYRKVVGDTPKLALGGGDDYELLFCTRTDLSDSALSRRLGVAVSRIGRIVPGPGAIRLKGRFASSVPAGWDQLRTPQPRQRAGGNRGGLR
jgi:thiamine-monophosphate kinase